MKRLLALVLVALAVPAAALAFDNTEPLAAKQWYFDYDQPWTYWPDRPELYPIRVAIVDSGIDGTHPEFKGRVVAARSFVGGSPFRDDQGHGTFVAGEIAANPANALGIAGLAFNAQLMVAKVVTPEGGVSLQAEVAAIRWAADNGARVINLSLGGVRDPLDPKLDTYSPLEQAAVEYAHSKGVVVVAAVGNGPQSPSTPWRFAHYPASLPHVIGVSAIKKDGTVPLYSNRDAIYNDVAAPGADMFSTIPTNLVEDRAECVDHAYSDCGPPEFQNAIGTSFAAPQVSAAAALLLGVDPDLRPEQVAWLLERSAADVEAPGRDALSGWGAVDVAAALALLAQGTLPPHDAYEPNDDAGVWSHAIPPLPRTVAATLDFWDDNVDVYRVRLAKGQRLFARTSSVPLRLSLWAPGTQRIESLADPHARLAQSRRAGGQARLSYRARKTGTYYLAVKLVAPARNPVAYKLGLAAVRP